MKGTLKVNCDMCFIVTSVCILSIQVTYIMIIVPRYCLEGKIVIIEVIMISAINVSNKSLEFVQRAFRHAFWMVYWSGSSVLYLNSFIVCAERSLIVQLCMIQGWMKDNLYFNSYKKNVQTLILVWDILQLHWHFLPSWQVTDASSVKGFIVAL
jgi:hypothetical protein